MSVSKEYKYRDFNESEAINQTVTFDNLAEDNYQYFMVTFSTIRGYVNVKSLTVTYTCT